MHQRPFPKSNFDFSLRGLAVTEILGGWFELSPDLALMERPPPGMGWGWGYSRVPMSCRYKKKRKSFATESLKIET
jgi:hypothetical protein